VLRLALSRDTNILTSTGSLTFDLDLKLRENVAKDMELEKEDYR